MPKAERTQILELLSRSLQRFVRLSRSDEEALRVLHPSTAFVQRGSDIVRQGDRPDVAVMILDGTLGRYVTVPSGRRQYLTMEIRGGLPDLQSLFLGQLDHALVALEDARIARLPHRELLKLFSHNPKVALACWRVTLIDAAIFRQAIASNGSRTPVERLAHFFCEQLYRARQVGLNSGQTCAVPLSQVQLGQMLGMSLVTTNRAVRTLRTEGCAVIGSGRLEVLNWRRLQARAGFDPAYLIAEQ